MLFREVTPSFCLSSIRNPIECFREVVVRIYHIILAVFREEITNRVSLITIAYDATVTVLFLVADSVKLFRQEHTTALQLY